MLSEIAAVISDVAGARFEFLFCRSVEQFRLVDAYKVGCSKIITPFSSASETQNTQ